MEIEPIAKIYTDFDSKFGIPRQPGLVPELKGKIIFEPKYKNIDSVRGLDSFSHIWLIWQFSENIRKNYSPTVRPPRLGGNIRMGVFACRSPFRPNNLGMSCVKLDKLDLDGPDAPAIYVSGIDMLSGTPIYDIKPYIPYSDCITQATEGFAPAPLSEFDVIFEEGCDNNLSSDKIESLRKVLSLDPRPHYQHDNREYGMAFAGYEIKFYIDDNIVHVQKITKSVE